MILISAHNFSNERTETAAMVGQRSSHTSRACQSFEKVTLLVDCSSHHKKWKQSSNMMILCLLLLLVVLLLSSSGVRGDEQHRYLQQRARNCSQPGRRCQNRRGQRRPCCQGPDACPRSGVCPSSRGAGGDTRPPPRLRDSPPRQFPPSTRVYEFAVIGDTPYSEYELCGIPYELNKMPANVRFLQHLGDIMDGQEASCSANRYRRVADAFRFSPVPVHFIMGDNSFTDCPEGEAWGYRQWFNSGLLYYGDAASRARVVRGSAFQFGDEYYYFVDDNNLFVGLSLPGGSPQQREQESVDWTRIALEQNRGVGAVVLFGHSARPGYLSGLRRIASEYSNVHILMLNDSHQFAEEYPFEGQFNVKLIRVDDTITPMSVYIDASQSNTDNVFTYNRGCYCTTDHRPTRIVQWQGQCQAVCRDVQTACAAFDTCSPNGWQC